MLQTYLERRKDKGRNIYIRMVAPKDVAPFLPATSRIFRKSLGTADAIEAAVLAQPLITSKLGEWDKVRKNNRPSNQLSTPQVVPPFISGEPLDKQDEIGPIQRSLTPQLIKTAVATRMASWLAHDDEERPRLDDDEFKEAVAYSEMSEANLRNFVARGAKLGSHPDIVEHAIEACEMLGVLVNQTDPLLPQLVREYAIGERRIHTLLNERNRGEWPETHELVPKVGFPLSSMIEVYRKAKSLTAGKHYISTGVSVWERLIEFKGDVFLDEVTSKDVYDLMEYHLRETKKWSPQYLDKVKTYLKDFFSHAITLTDFAGPNPILTLEKVPQLEKSERKERNKPRYPLSTDQLNTLFSSEWYNPLSTLWRGQLAQDLGCRYFMPIISVLHGCRVREPLQLMTNEIVNVGGVVCFNFRVEFDDADSGKHGSKAVEVEVRDDDWPPRSFKNDSAIRLVPVHPLLIKLGFLDYVQQRREELGRPGPVFQSALPEPGGESPKYGRAYEQAMLRFMKSHLKFGPGFGNHSHRHGFEDRVRQANAEAPWPGGMWQHLTGRRLPGQKENSKIAPVGSEADYGHGYAPEAVAKYQASISFVDIKFPSPFAKWKKSEGR